MTLTATQRVLAAREGGNVRRCHTIPHHGEYTVGKHSFDAVSLLLILHPNPSVALIKALMWHDCAERWTGDVPSPAKRKDELFHNALDRLELGELQNWELYEGFIDLTDDDYPWLHAIDQLEFWLWCHEQEALGNKHVTKAHLHVEKLIERLADRMPQPCLDFYAEFQWGRLPEDPRNL